ncbi:hypothetical protein SAMN02746065_10663 [Desulfocicer vacuolatum DSM 3385]|uniref:Uncharacterized protein n=1 Tax=Desulfocicer vacuolatum DSM 3385 TaxID=1121400 RepID=A0A1W2ASP6_9BACT|nr:hypothetical protein SAMN02746065_10663 [Desulfocicer vacuolatum DSM 3385]
MDAVNRFYNWGVDGRADPCLLYDKKPGNRAFFYETQF